jgi:hypothetical protein
MGGFFMEIPRNIQFEFYDFNQYVLFYSWESRFSIIKIHF